MNQETQKQFMVKLLLVSGVGCLAWNFMVKPAHEKVDQQRQTLKSQRTLIQAYNSQVGLPGAGSSVETERVLDQITSDIDSRDSNTSLHTLINESSAKNGVSVSRIESVNSRDLSQRIDGSDREVTGVNHTVRIEFEGEYSSVLDFMDEVVSGSVQVKFSNFRFVPTGYETIRANAEINSVILTSILSETGMKGMANE